MPMHTHTWPDLRPVHHPPHIPSRAAPAPPPPPRSADMGQRCRLKGNPWAECFSPYKAADVAPTLAAIHAEARDPYTATFTVRAQLPSPRMDASIAWAPVRMNAWHGMHAPTGAAARRLGASGVGGHLTPR